jgi:hypothetical protein
MLERDEWFSDTTGMKCADTGNRNSGDLTRNVGGRRCREEKLVVFASMQGGMERVFLR